MGFPQANLNLAWLMELSWSESLIWVENSWEMARLWCFPRERWDWLPRKPRV